MILERYNEPMRTREIMQLNFEPDLTTGIGHGHIRKRGQTRPRKDALAKKHKRAKMSKASRKRNRRGQN